MRLRLAQAAPGAAPPADSLGQGKTQFSPRFAQFIALAFSDDKRFAILSSTARQPRRGSRLFSCSALKQS
ncbi:hypothetical protein [Janthinobacterium sp. TND4EL3]|uniref:hypothetical protein n=1 Tax=Janthinobacterium sp. TND4EL3 TaxID=1907311 RepID=UPI001BB04F42|nr:hypothetical protein [Janthinobacterium sp. TND4EL3]